MRKLKHKVLINFDSTIFYKQRRYICHHCGKTFVEFSPFTENRYIMTPTTIMNILKILKPYTYSSVEKNMAYLFQLLSISLADMFKFLERN